MTNTKEYMKAWREKNKEKLREDNRRRMKAWREKNKEKALELNRIYRLKRKDCPEYKEKRRLAAIEYRTKNKEAINKRARQRRKRSDVKEHYKIYHREYKKERYNSSVNFKIKEIISGRIRSVLKNKSILKSSRTTELLGTSLDNARKHIESQFKEGMTWENHGIFGWHIDHIIPCASFDLTDPEQQKQCFHYSNLQPLWSYENLQKGNKIIG